jgi:16S rRNA (cytosine967-C5)-methyltransferase
MTSAREAALEVLVRFDGGGVHLRSALEDEFAKAVGLPARDKAFCRDLANAAVRRLNTLDWALNKFADSAVDKLTPQVRNILRLGACQILYLSDRVPAYAAVNECVELAKKHARPAVVSFVNALLRSLERERNSLPWPDAAADPVAALSLRESHPAWLVRRWLDRWGREECEALLKADNEPAPLTVRVNTLKTTRAALHRSLLEAGVEAELSPVCLDGLRLVSYPSLSELSAFGDGLFTVQDDASQVVADVLDPRPGETVVDLCAAPGGKSTHLGARMENRGAVLAFDVSLPSLRRLNQNVARLGVTVVQPFLVDAREAGKKYMGSADRVLVDAPCSALGVLRRRPDVRWNKNLRDVLTSFPAVQGELLRAGALCLKPGGVLVYSTCTTEPEENEKVVAAFLAENPRFRVDSVAPFLADGLDGAVTPEGYLRLLPHRHGTDGFFAARLVLRP